ncbi:MAG: LLM class F420-dependent oxidoreductase [Alphaproteobacteria bacterium]
MHIGAHIFLTDYSIPPQELGPALEERGFESVWLPEHSHIPLPRVSPWPGGGDLPKKYYDVMDPFVALGAIAATTTTLKMGTGICLVIQRDPIQTAKEVSTIDRLSNGRFLFGVGAGWNEEEMADHGTEPKTRFRLMRERIEAMKAIWTESKPKYDGEFVKFGEMMSWPKPKQEPHPPVIVGGAFPYGARRAIRFGDGWIPLGGKRGVDIANQLPHFRQMAAEAGRNPDDIEVSVFGAKPDSAELTTLKGAGVARVTFDLPSAPRDEILPLLDNLAKLI